ncbi:hypothetical protein ODJ79_08200 [Actinoplanes sp. KI2]|uniref:hypothetical protein n=1 Tax=Actinoplanes sp. KI2 TaxID=2983315 RepID=UPI0021D5D210|nr:hypothetical protein [Actinoplanes sp. KI2]MCU7723690.1 hypothetical protein [Actinoplanes sp. KI2]
MPHQAGSTAVREPAAPAVHRPWRALLRRCLLAPLVVLAPLVTLTFSADHRFNVYNNGGQYATHPWRLFETAVATVPPYLALGNFRPLGRMLEWSLDVAAFALTALFGVPATIGLRVISFVAAILLTLAAVAFAEAVVARRRRLFAGSPSVTAALLPFAVAAGLVAAGWLSTTVLFGGLYLTTSALVLGVAAWACRARRAGVLVVLVGAGLAAFNELACLAVPLATVAVLLRGRVVLGLDWRRVLRGTPARFAGLLWVGFLPVFVPVRLIIRQRCASGGCYVGSDIAYGGAAAALPGRMLSWLPPLMWPRAAGGEFPHLAAAVPAMALIALAVLAWRALRGLRSLPTLDGRQSAALAGVAVALLVLAGALAALSADAQRLPVGGGWRDSGLTTVAGSVLVLALWRRFVVVLLVLLVVAGTISAAANKDFRDASAGGRFPYLYDRIAQEVAGFDRTPAGDARRCALRAAFKKVNFSNVERFDVSLDRATRLLDGRRFCSRAPR